MPATRPFPDAAAAGLRDTARDDDVAAAHGARSLAELLHDGGYMVHLLRAGRLPSDPALLRERVRRFLADFERGAARLGADAGDVRLACFACCALIDETVLASAPRLRDAWEPSPLQLEYFGEQLAGERFFEHLEALRLEGAARLPVLEVFHLCLLLGFQGRYRLEESDRLDGLIARLGEEIARLRGRRAEFAPHREAPDRPAHVLRREAAPWAVAAAFALAALLGYAGLRTVLERQTAADLAPYGHVVELAAPAPHVVITLP